MNVRIWNEQSFPIKTRVVFTHAGVDNILFCVSSNNKQWLRMAPKIESLSLTNSIIMCTVVLTYHIADCRFKVVGFRRAFQIAKIYPVVKNGGICRNLNHLTFLYSKSLL